MSNQFRILVTCLVSLLLGACATQPAQKPMYYWGSYQEQVYGHLNGKTAPEEQIAALQADAEKARAEGLALPPGYRAHLGMMHAASGRLDQAPLYFAEEKEFFPESAGFMDFLLQKFKK